MKITKNDLKKLIMEELQKIDEISPKQKAANEKSGNKRLAGLSSLRQNRVDTDEVETYVQAINPKNLEKPIKIEKKFEAYMDKYGKIRHSGTDMGGSPNYIPEGSIPVTVEYKTVAIVKKK
jgi:tRNA U34 5-carboxymethylaminomethyl modifying enzyme MnmG/GidA